MAFEAFVQASVGYQHKGCSLRPRSAVLRTLPSPRPPPTRLREGSAPWHKNEDETKGNAYANAAKAFDKVLLPCPDAEIFEPYPCPELEPPMSRCDSRKEARARIRRPWLEKLPSQKILDPQTKWKKAVDAIHERSLCIHIQKSVHVWISELTMPPCNKVWCQ